MLISATVNSVLLIKEDDEHEFLYRYLKMIGIMMANIVTLEALAKSKMTETSLKNHDLGNMAQGLHFLRKRIPCNCLDAMYKKARDVLPRIPRCSNMNCRAFTDKKELQVCTKCKTAQYCSRECQVADWPEHKHRCRDSAKFHEET